MDLFEDFMVINLIDSSKEKHLFDYTLLIIYTHYTCIRFIHPSIWNSSLFSTPHPSYHRIVSLKLSCNKIGNFTSHWFVSLLVLIIEQIEKKMYLCAIALIASLNYSGRNYVVVSVTFDEHNYLISVEGSWHLIEEKFTI